MTQTRYILLCLIVLIKVCTSTEYCTNGTFADLPSCSTLIGKNSELLPFCCGSWSDGGNNCRLMTSAMITHSLYPNITFSSIHIVEECTSAVFSTLDCTTSCHNIAGIRTCNGSTSYCNARLTNNFTACSLTPECQCLNKTMYSGYWFFDSTMSNTQTCSYTLYPVYYDISALLDTYLVAEQLSIKYDNKGSFYLHANVSDPITCYIVKDKHEFNFTFKSDFVYTLPDFYLIKESYANISCYDEGKLIKTLKVLIEPKGICQNFPMFSQGWWFNFQCKSFKEIFIIVCSLLSIAVIYFLLYLRVKNPIKSVFCVIKDILYMIYWLIISFVLLPLGKGDFQNVVIIDSIKNKFKNMWKSFSYYFRMKEVDDYNLMKKTDVIVNPRSSSKTVQKINFNGIIVDRHILILALLFLIIGACNSQCVDSDIVTGSLTECTQVNQMKQCKLAFNSNIVIPNIYEETCINVKAEDSSILTIKFSAQVQGSYSTQSLYYTSDYDMDIRNNLVCNSETMFKHSVLCPNSGCLAVNPSSGKNIVKKLDGSTESTTDNGAVSGYTGKSGCLNVPSPSACYFNNEACSYYRYVFKPKGNAYRVSKLLSASIKPIITVTVVDGNGTSSMVVSQIGEKYYIGDNKKVSFTILGTFSMGSFFTDALYIVNDVITDAGWLASASPVNLPTESLLGDIQSAEPSAFSRPFNGVDNFIMPQTGFSVKVHDNNREILDLVRPANTGVGNFIKSRQAFPMTLNGQKWTYKAGTLTTMLTNIPAITLKLVTETPINVQYIHVDVDPICSFVAASGCSNCDIGSVIKLNCKSVSTPGTVYLSTESKEVSIRTKVISITANSDDYFIQMTTTIVKNDFNLLIAGTNKIIKINVVFDAKHPSYIKNDTQSITNGTSFDPESSFGGIDFSAHIGDGLGFSNPLDSLITYGIIGLGVVIVIGVIIFVLKR